MVIVIMGVAGSGKTTVGRALAAQLRWPFHEADDLHSPGNIAKIAAGIPLTDDDRAPWLARVRQTVIGIAARNGNGVVACSALRTAYRARIAAGLPGVHWVYLKADRPLLEDRLRSRRAHFAGVSILDSQLAVLEVPDDALVVSAAATVDVIVRQICSWLKLPCDQGGDDANG